ncbi:hypothetical protein FGW37_28715 [Streptomyces rectiverticillatus]|uniref:hypothetical protein n=1 Tax=Streptomyces rectiverticillatus TaxID=173860 RepID=UPI0015C32AC5|nr:hypothetical protein [Streptomyces rectiverticillatus]QLE75054.1 hypothetical protein FGW37_28715 [Streptomyces rectiverticillatus]
MSASGPAPARDHDLGDLAWLTASAFGYTEDSVWEPLAPPTPSRLRRRPAAGPGYACRCSGELLAAIARRQHEYREWTAERLTAVLTTGLPPGELTELAVLPGESAQ